MNYLVFEVALAVNGRMSDTAAPAEVLVVSGVRTDSREVMPGDLFVPLIADRDGHEFIDEAIRRGATSWLTSRADDRHGAVNVGDTFQALELLASDARRRMEGWGTTVIGVTGSSGKTSTKDLLRAILSAHGPAGASDKSYNNEIGAPLTLLNSPDLSWAVAVEMGARGLGHIARLCELARPSIGIVTNVGTAHLAMYDGPEGIVQAKGELVGSLPATGTAVLNASDAAMPVHAALTKARVLTFGIPPRTGQLPDVSADGVALDDLLRGSFILRSPWGSTEVRLQARGEHQVLNALAAAGAALAAGASLAEVAEGLSTDVLSPWRMEMGRTGTGALLINDAYNANDQSMAAAVKALATVAGKRRIAVLGTMAELGEHAGPAHAAIMALARSLSIDVIVAVDQPLYEGADHSVKSPAEVPPLLAALGLGHGDVVLLKGSRMAGLEQVAHALVRRADGSRPANGGDPKEHR